MFCRPVSGVGISVAEVKTGFLQTTTWARLRHDVSGGTISIFQRPQAVRRSGRSKNNTHGNHIFCESLVLVLIAFSMTGGYGDHTRTCVTASTGKYNSLTPRCYDFVILPTGSRIVTSVPSPTLLRIETCPPCRSMILRTW